MAQVRQLRGECVPLLAHIFPFIGFHILGFDCNLLSQSRYDPIYFLFTHYALLCILGE